MTSHPQVGIPAIGGKDCCIEALVGKLKPSSCRKENIVFLLINKASDEEK
jgi:hypothetical protein